MEKIQLAKAAQCPVFREKLSKSAGNLLAHNMETDAKWGCEPDGKGLNKMGKILMTVREQLSKEHFPRNKTPTQTNPRPTLTQTNPQPDVHNLCIIGNSNVRGLAAKLTEKGTKATSFVFPGRMSAQITERIHHCKPTSDLPTHIVLHTGDIDARRGLPIEQTLNVIQETTRMFPSSKVIVNSVPVTVRNRRLQDCLHEMNQHLRNICNSLPNVTLIDTSRLHLRDQIHLTQNSLSTLAGIIENHL
jgi:hypothetical protein